MDRREHPSLHPDPGSLQSWMLWGQVVMSTSLSKRSSNLSLSIVPFPLPPPFPFPALPCLTSSTFPHSLSTFAPYHKLCCPPWWSQGGANLAFEICHCATIRGTNPTTISLVWTSVLAEPCSRSNLSLIRMPLWIMARSVGTSLRMNSLPGPTNSDSFESECRLVLTPAMTNENWWEDIDSHQM